MRRILLLFVICFSFSALSCFYGGNRTALLWTDRPEFALYGEYFNAAQDQYKIETRYFDSLAQKLVEGGEYADIVAGRWLKSSSTRALFRPLDSYLGESSIPKSAFYPKLLAMGNIDGKQYLLPVSFNAPALIFAREKGELLSNPFTVGFEEMKKLGKDFNVERGGVYTRMGFSPAWDDNFLYITADLFNVSFREASPLAWDSSALDRAMSFVYDWTHEVNTDIQAEEDFTFKYFYTPPEKLVLSERVFFSYMKSDDLFTLAEERRNNLDFRWIAERNTIPLTEGSIYLGIPKKGKSKKAAAAFIRWFFKPDTQRLLLEYSRDNRMLETTFGIGGGFSALRVATEQIYPQFYPGLLGHMPPEDFLSPANILPRNWTNLKERIILPYLNDRARHASRDEIRPLERRISDWLRLNR
ncbi:MAG: extracellular solute-binding protein [Treponema sp.]|jgi:ABC-type glycerol-3-phosphate transport system substrate-binding protein|nr:extracellular solute-binding protein [Treponema sp.]